MTQLIALNGYQQRLYRHILDYFPYMQDDKQEMFDFIVERAELAHKAYIQASNEGKGDIEADDDAYATLYADLHFSPITYLIETYTQQYGIEISKEDACKIFKNDRVKALFEKFGTDIEGDDDEHLLMEELKPYFKILSD